MESAVYTAVGRVASASAVLEDHLRYVAVELTGDPDRSWVLFTGRDTRKLIEDCRALLSQLVSRWPDNFTAQLETLLLQAETQLERRNAIIHGIVTETDVPGMYSFQRSRWFKVRKSKALEQMAEFTDADAEAPFTTRLELSVQGINDLADDLASIGGQLSQTRTGMP